MLVGAVGIGLGILAFLLLPISLHVELAGGRRSAILRWAFGLVQVDLFAGHGPRGRSARRTPRVGRRPLLARVRAAMGTQGLFTRVSVLLQRLLRATHPRELRIAARIGLADPADTGLLWAAIASAAPFVEQARWPSISLEPDFENEALLIDGHARLTVIPAEVLLVLLGFLLSRPVLRAAWAVARA